MRIPVSWLRELVTLPAEVTTADIADALTKCGLQVERTEVLAGDISGPVIVGKVLEFVDEPQKNGKIIRWCQVEVGEDEPRGIVCGAHNFEANDYVVVSLPGAELAGGFKISARKTYGHISDGMICSELELGLGEDHDGIIVLPEIVDGKPLEPGEDALAVMAARDEVFEIDVTPDMGYCLSMRGIARETAQAFGVKFEDPYGIDVPAESSAGYPVKLESENCELFTALTVTGFDPTAQTPMWMKHRVQAAGMRSISLAVDITNYVMLESGQPLHAYDKDSLQGAIVVRQAVEGEKMTTLDNAERTLSAEDLLITDDSGPIGLAGTMGGLETELEADTTNIVIEAANFSSVSVSRTFRRHKLPSEASKRFERSVDPNVAYAAALRCAELLVEYGGGTISADETIVGAVPESPKTRIKTDLPARILGADVSAEQAKTILEASGVSVQVDGDEFVLTPPSWRSDLRDPYDYVEDVGRKLGFDRIPSTLPIPPAGRGLTFAQRSKRQIGQAVAALGFVEVITLPFIGDSHLDKLSLDEDDSRRATVRLANPLDDTEPYLRTTLLPGLFSAVTRNTSRSQNDLSLYEIGSVFHAVERIPTPMPRVDQRPSQEEIDQIERSLPRQPWMLGAVLTGNWQAADWRGDAVPATWANAIELAMTAGRAVGVELTRKSVAQEPWHPGRCAELFAGSRSLGFAGELHPTVCEEYGLPTRTCAVELNIDELIAAAPRNGEIFPLSPFPLTKEDVALIVDLDVPAGEISQALTEGCGELLEAVTLFDVYHGDQIGADKKSLAFSLAFRAPDRTLNEAEAMEALERGVQLASERFGAVRRA